MAIDKIKLIKEIEELPFIHGRYDHIHANPAFIGGCESMHELIKNVIETQPELSLETKTSDWIPCSERLPKKNGIYRVTFVSYGKRKIDYCFYEKYLKDFIANGKVVAWMENPEPYKG